MPFAVIWNYFIFGLIFLALNIEWNWVQMAYAVPQYKKDKALLIFFFFFCALKYLTSDLFICFMYNPYIYFIFLRGAICNHYSIDNFFKVGINLWGCFFSHYFFICFIFIYTFITIILKPLKCLKQRGELGYTILYFNVCSYFLLF